MRRGRLVGTALVAALALTAPADAKTFEVTRHNDPNPGPCKPNDCSLREAIIAANNRAGRDVVLLPDRRPRYNLRRPNVTPKIDEDDGGRGDLDVTGPLTIRHPGRGKATIDGNGIDRVLETQARTVLKKLKITGGSNVSEDPMRGGRRTFTPGSAGGIETHARLTVKRSAVVGNEGAGTGGGINAEPAPGDGAPPASLRLVRSKVARNDTVNGTGGGLFADFGSITVVRSRLVANHAEYHGGAISAFNATIRISRSTLERNVVDSSAGGGILAIGTPTTVLQSTVSGNRSTSGGGGIFSSGQRLQIVNSTIAGNQAGGDGGGVSSQGNDLFLRSATIARNIADANESGGEQGGGLSILSSGASIVNTLFVRNELGDGTDSDCTSDTPVDSEGGNMLTVAAGCTGFEFGAGDFLTANPKIGVLRNNGGPTKTIALKGGSPAIGKAVEAAAPNRDQRGVKRDRRPDIGAYERKRRRR